MILNFPESPENGDTYLGSNGTLYIFDGEKWNGQAVLPQGPTGPTGPTGPENFEIDGGNAFTIYLAEIEIDGGTANG